MATIKTTGTGAGLRVLTKTAGGEVRVSCECCEEAECCMYPADHDWGDGSDLPDAITLILPQGSPLILNAIRNGDEFYVADPVYWSPVTKAPSPETGYSPRQYFRIKKEMDYLMGHWIVQFRYEDEQDWNGGGGGGPCLIIGDGNLTPRDDRVEDQFADTYTITWTYLGIAHSEPLIRFGLCNWFVLSGLDALAVYYISSVSNMSQPEWWNGPGFYIDNSNLYGEVQKKTGDQSSPVGTYTIGGITYTVA